MKKIFTTFIFVFYVLNLQGQTAGGGGSRPLRVKIESVTSYKNGVLTCWGLNGSDTIYLTVKWQGIGKNRVRAGSILSVETSTYDKRNQIYYRNIKLIQP